MTDTWQVSRDYFKDLVRREAYPLLFGSSATLINGGPRPDIVEHAFSVSVKGVRYWAFYGDNHLRKFLELPTTKQLTVDQIMEEIDK